MKTHLSLLALFLESLEFSNIYLCWYLKCFFCFVLISFRVSGLILRSLTCLELVFVYGERHCSSFILPCVDIGQQYLLRRLFAQMCFFSDFIKNPVAVWVYNRVSCAAIDLSLL